MRTITLKDFLTPREVREAVRLYERCDGTGFAERCANDIIRPNMARINRALGQETDAKFLAYAVEYAIVQSTRR